MRHNWSLIILLVTILGGMSVWATGAQAQLHNPCPYTNDGDCDEPNGLNLCAPGTDTVDCSNPNSNYGSGSGYGGSAGSTAGGTGSSLHNPCPYTNDGDCDEPNGLNLCAPGTDTVDCSNPNSNYGSGSGYAGGSSGGSTAGGTTTGGGSNLHNPCPYTNDGDCDEPNGLNLCAPGTDTADCSNPNSNYGSGSGYAGGGGGGAVAGAATFSPWTRVTNDPRQFAAQPGGVFPLRITGGSYFNAGQYVIYHGLTDGSGPNAPIRDIQSVSVTLAPDTGYIARASTLGFESFTTGGGALTMYSAPERGRAMIYVRNDDNLNWRAICVLPAGMPVAQCGADGGGGGAAAAAPTTFSPWTRITSDQRQNASQPGRVSPLRIVGGMTFSAGQYVIYNGFTDSSGPNAPIWNVQSTPITLDSNRRYAVHTRPPSGIYVAQGGALIMYGEPGPGRAMIYARNDDSSNWRALCVLPQGMPMTQCGN